MRRLHLLLITALGIALLVTPATARPAAAASSTRWQYAGSLQIARQQAGIASAPCTNNVSATCVYAVDGGQLTSGNTLTIEGNGEQYDPSTNQWTLMPTPPETVIGPATVGGPCPVTPSATCLYMIGGNNGTDSLTRTHVYLPSQGTWVRAADMNTGRANAGAAAGPCFGHTADTCLYALGGDDSTDIYDPHLASSEMYDPSNNSWSGIHDLPTPADSIGAAAAPCVGAVMRTCIYAVGGGSSGGALDSVNMYDPTANTWTPEASLPSPKFAAGVVSGPCPDPIATCIYAAGGSNGAYSDWGTTAVFDPRTNNWTSIDELNTARRFTGAAVAPCTSQLSATCVYVAQGTDSPGNELTSTEMLNPSVWSAGASLASGLEYAAATEAPCPGYTASCLWTLGGLDSSHHLRATIQQYTPGTGWSTASDTLSGAKSFLASATAPCVSNTARLCPYAVGGMSDASDTGSTALDEYNVLIQQRQAEAPMPTARGGLGAAAGPCHGDLTHTCIYAAGGFNGAQGSPLSAVEMFNPGSNSWTTSLPGLPTGVLGTGAAAASCTADLTRICIYVAGGSTGSTPTGAIQEYDPSANSWSNPGSLLQARYLAGVTNGPCLSAPSRACLYVLGGDSGTGPLASIEVWDPATAQAQIVGFLPTARRALTAASGPCDSSGTTVCAYAIGGEDGSSTVSGEVDFSFALGPLSPPAAVISSPADNQTYALHQSVGTTYSCSDSLWGAGLSACQDGTGSSGSGTLDTSQGGNFTYTVTATSFDGQSSHASIHYTVNQADPPTAGISSPADNQTYGQNQNVPTFFSCSESNNGSGLKSCIDSRGVAGNVTGNSASGAGTLDTSQLGTNLSYTVTATSTDGETGSKTIHYNVVSSTAPTASISAPADNQHYLQNHTVPTSFACQDGTAASGLVSCVDSNGASATVNGSSASGAGSLDTSTVGANLAYTVTATSQDTQTGTATIHYSVYAGGGPAPSVTLPTDGSTFTLNQSVSTTFKCAEEEGGPGLAVCSDSRGSNGTISQDGLSASGSGSLDTSRVGSGQTYTVTAGSVDGLTNQQTIHYTVTHTPPAATVLSPANNQTYQLNQSVPTSFSCTESADGTGLSACSDSNGAQGTISGDTRSGSGTGTLDTSAPGTFSYTITGTSQDGTSGTGSITYHVTGSTTTLTCPTYHDLTAAAVVYQTITLTCAHADVIAFPASSPLPADQLPVTTIDASSSPGAITLEGNGASNFFTMGSTHSLTLKGLTLAHGSANSGGAIDATRGSLTLIGDTFTGNSSTSTTGGGGAVFAEGPLTVENSTFSGNSTNTTAGLSTVGGAIDLQDNGGGATSAIVNSTFINNSAPYGSAVTIETASEYLVFLNDTITGSQGGVALKLSGQKMALGNTIIAGNGGANCEVDYGPVQDLGHNLYDSSASAPSLAKCGTAAASDLVNTAPILGTLGNYGGPVPTVPLLAGSPAIGAADPVLCADQTYATAWSVAVPAPAGQDGRGFSRHATACDIGAFETGARTAGPSSSSGPTITNITPNSVKAGGQATTLTIEGQNFGPAGGSVSIGGTPYTPASWGRGIITVNLDPGALLPAVDEVQVKDAGQTPSNLLPFILTGAPTTVSALASDSSQATIPGVTGELSAGQSGGSGPIEVAQYTANPTTASLAQGQDYFDVHLAGTTMPSSVIITDCTANDQTLLWSNPKYGQWGTVSNVSTSNGCLMATITSSTSPSINDLSGAVFGGSTSSNPTRALVAAAHVTHRGKTSIVRWRMANQRGVVGYQVYGNHHLLTHHLIRVHRSLGYTFRTTHAGPYRLRIVYLDGRASRVTLR